MIRILLFTFILFILETAASANDRAIILQSTTSTANSGLYDHILPMFEKETGIKVHVVAVGTGQALRNARNGDGDVLLVHAKAAEEKFVINGYGLRRHDVMYNDFVIVGPAADPASIAGSVSAAAALARIAENQQIFASRGDDSGTHSKERDLWQIARIDPTIASGTWYRETGSGMGATLNLAAGMGAYTLTDRATWLTFGNKRNLTVLFEGDPALFNQYGIVIINPNKHPRVKAKFSQRFTDWILGSKGQNAIAGFTVRGTQLFYPNSRRQ